MPWLLPPNFSRVLPIFFCAHALGLFAYYLPKFGALFGAMFAIGPEEAVPIRLVLSLVFIYTFCSTFFFSLGSFSLLVLLLPFLSRPKLRLPEGTHGVAKCLVCLEMAALAGGSAQHTCETFRVWFINSIIWIKIF